MNETVAVEVIGLKDFSCGPFPCDEERSCGLETCYPTEKLVPAFHALKEKLEEIYNDRVVVRLTLIDDEVPDRIRRLIDEHQPVGGSWTDNLAPLLNVRTTLSLDLRMADCIHREHDGVRQALTLLACWTAIEMDLSDVGPQGACLDRKSLLLLTHLSTLRVIVRPAFFHPRCFAGVVTPAPIPIAKARRTVDEPVIVLVGIHDPGET